MDVNLIIVGQNSRGEAFYSFINKPTTPRAARRFPSKCIHTVTRVDPATGEEKVFSCRNEVAINRPGGWLCAHHDAELFPTLKLSLDELRRINSGWVGRVERVVPSSDELDVLRELMSEDPVDDEAFPIGYGHGV